MEYIPRLTSLPSACASSVLFENQFHYRTISNLLPDDIYQESPPKLLYSNVLGGAGVYAALGARICRGQDVNRENGCKSVGLYVHFGLSWLLRSKQGPQPMFQERKSRVFLQNFLSVGRSPSCLYHFPGSYLRKSDFDSGIRIICLTRTRVIYLYLGAEKLRCSPHLPGMLG